MPHHLVNGVEIGRRRPVRSAGAETLLGLELPPAREQRQLAGVLPPSACVNKDNPPLRLIYLHLQWMLAVEEQSQWHRGTAAPAEHEDRLPYICESSLPMAPEAVPMPEWMLQDKQMTSIDQAASSVLPRTSASAQAKAPLPQWVAMRQGLQERRLPRCREMEVWMRVTSMRDCRRCSPS